MDWQIKYWRTVNNLFNAASRHILIRDMSDMLDWDLIEKKFNHLTWKDNINNHVSVEMDFFDGIEFAKCRSNILNDCKDYLNHTLNLSHFYTDLKMTNSWGNITNPGEKHHDHVHPFSVVSGVIYLDKNIDNLNLYIESYVPDVPYFITKNKSYVSLASLLSDTGFDFINEKYLQHHMILFLSNSSHFVSDTNPEGSIRRSIAFNTFWSGHTGVKDESLGSIIF